MKNLDIKKLLFLIVIVAVVILGIFLIGKSIKSNNAKEEEIKTYEKLSLDYFLNLTAGYNTSYNGVDILFNRDETKLEDIEYQALINTAIKYVNDKEKSTNVNHKVLVDRYKEKYPKMKDSVLYNAEDIRKGLEELFGITDFHNPTLIGNHLFTTDYTYISEEDVYMLTKNSTPDYNSKNQSMDYSLIETKEEKNKIVTRIAVAYVYETDEKKTYAKDRLGEKVIVENSKEFPTNKIEKFNKYDITLTKTKKGNYIFESVKKVK